MWRLIENKETGKKTEVNCCPACLAPFLTLGYCAPCNRNFAHTEKPLPTEKDIWSKGR